MIPAINKLSVQRKKKGLSSTQHQKGQGSNV